MNTLPIELVESIRGELLKLVQAPDIDKNLIAIGKLSARARDLFMVLKSPEAAVKGRRRFSSDEEDGEDGYSGSGTMTANPSSTETFGAKAIREIIGAMPSLMNAQNETPSALVIAASIARDRGMFDLSAELEKKLVGHTLEGDRPVDRERMRDIAFATTPEGLKARYLGAAGGALVALGAAASPVEPTPPPSAEEDEDDLDQDEDEAAEEA